MTGKPYEPLHRQCYRLRSGVNRNHFVICPDWVREGWGIRGRYRPFEPGLPGPPDSTAAPD